MNTSAFSYFHLICRTLVGVVMVTSFASCEDNALTPAEQEVATFSQQLQGTWLLDKVTVSPSTSQTVTIAPVREFACDKVSAAFKSKDVVNQYEISYSDKVVHVKKRYTCRLAPEELSWQIQLCDESDDSENWMSGKNFIIREVNEASVNAEFKLLFFNLTNTSPDGKAATSSTRNKLRIEVTHDTKEESNYTLEFSKVQ